MRYVLFALLLIATPALAAVTAVSVNMNGLVDTVVSLIIIGCVFGLLYFLVGAAPFIPDPFKAWIRYFILFVAVLWIIGLLLGFIGHPIAVFR